jgi:hypothetical protein
MSFRERNVLGTLVDGDGSPIINGKIKFVPSEKIGLTATHVVIDREIIIQTGADGTFTASLWCDEDSSVAINWNVTFPVTNNGEPEPAHLKQFSLAYNDGTDIYIGTLIALGLPAPDDTTLLYQAVYAYILTLIADGTIGGGEGGGLTTEQVQDIVGAMFQTGTNMSFNYNDATGKLEIDAIDISEEEIEDRVAALLAAGANTTVTYNDGANTLTIAETAAGKTTEEIQDIVAALLASGSNVTLTYNDAGNVLTIAASGGGGGISNLAEDTSPQLGADLDLNTFRVGDATADDLTKLNALTATSVELNYIDGVTAPVQDQLDAKAAKTVTVETVSGTTYTLVLADHNKIKRFTNNSAITLTLAPSLGAAFAVGIIQRGDGNITWSNGSGVTSVNPSGHTKSIKDGVVSIFADEANKFIVMGATQS